MKRINELKQQLLRIKENDWHVSEDINKYELALEIMENIGSIDPVLRDELILEFLCEMIVKNHLIDEEVREIERLALSEKHLFNNIGKMEDDSVFNRSFTVLVIRCILYCHNRDEGKLFTEKEIIKTHRRNFLLALYFRLKRRNNAKSLIDVIDEVLDNITPNYFK